MKILIGILLILTVIAQASMWEWTHWTVVEKHTYTLDVAAPDSGIDHVHYKFHFPATLEKDVCTQASEWDLRFLQGLSKYTSEPVLVEKCP